MTDTTNKSVTSSPKSRPHGAMNGSEWALLIALSLLWGGSFFFNGVAIKELPTLTVVVCRVAIAALLLLIVLVVRGEARFKSALWPAFFIMGFLNNVVPFTLIVWGQSQIASGLTAILNATTPLFGVLVAHLCTRDEKLTGGRIAGVLLGVLGVGVLVGADLSADVLKNVWAQIACLGAALSYAVAGIYGRRFRELGATPMQTATGQVTAASILLIPVMLFVDQPWTLATPSVGTIAALFGLAALSTALAYILYFQILSAAGATNLLLVTLLIPVSSILLGTAFLNEILEAKHFAGMALIGLGLLAIDGRIWRRLRGRPAA